MLGRTHFFIGTAAALAVLQPQTVPVLVTGAGAAAIGSLISDIDVGTSQAHRDADKIITATVAVAALTILAEYKLNLGIYRRLTSDSNILRLLAGTAAFLLLCAYGKQQPHRSSCTHLRRWHCLRHAWTLSIRMPPPILPLVFYPTWCSMF